MNTKSILHYGQMVCVMLLFTIAQSCSEVVLEDPVLPAGADSSLLTKASNPVVEFVADSVFFSESTTNSMCVDLHGNLYFLKANNDDNDAENIMRYNYVSSDVDFLFSSWFSHGRSVMSVDSQGNLYRAHYAERVLFKYRNDGVVLRNFDNILFLNSPQAICCDANDNIYVHTHEYLTNKSNLVKIGALGKITLLAQPEPSWYLGLHKGKSNYLYTSFNYYNHTNQYDKIALKDYLYSSHSAGVHYSAMGCGMNDGFVYLLSYNTIHRLNPNNNQVIQKAIVPTSVMKDGENKPLGQPVAIYPTPNGDAVYVLCYGTEGYTGSILIKITF